MVGLQIMNPAAQKTAKNRFRAAPQVADLSGKTVGLYDNCKPGGEVAQQRVSEQLAARYGAIQFKRYSGTIGGRSTLTAQGAKAIAAECDAVIGIRGD